MVRTEVNIILLGESKVGKSSLLHRFRKGVFREKQTVIDVDFHVKYIIMKNKEVKLCIWDTAGQEKYRSIVRSYYRVADGVLLVYDVTNVPSFHNLRLWLYDLKQHNEDAIVVIVGNKNEDPNAKLVDVSTVTKFCQHNCLEYAEVSAKNGENVEKVFKCLIEKILIAKGILQPSQIKPAVPELNIGKLQEPLAAISPGLFKVQCHGLASPQSSTSSTNDDVKLDDQVNINAEKKCCCV